MFETVSNVAYLCRCVPKIKQLHINKRTLSCNLANCVIAILKRAFLLHRFKVLDDARWCVQVAHRVFDAFRAESQRVNAS